jgi:hypothetical protein
MCCFLWQCETHHHLRMNCLTTNCVNNCGEKKKNLIRLKGHRKMIFFFGNKLNTFFTCLKVWNFYKVSHLCNEFKVHRFVAPNLIPHVMMTMYLLPTIVTILVLMLQFTPCYIVMGIRFKIEEILRCEHTSQLILHALEFVQLDF